MSCHSCGSSTPPTTATGSCTNCGTPAPCRQPRRSCAKPVLATCFDWIGRLMGLNQGKLVLKDGDCLGYLDDVVSGPVIFDAQEKVVYIGDSGNPDTYACAVTQPSGFPVM